MKSQLQQILEKLEYVTKVVTWLINTIRGALDTFPKKDANQDTSAGRKADP